MQSIYVGNVSWNMSSEQLKELFEKIGTVSSSRIITDRETGRSRGFGFVEMSEEDAKRAVSEFDGQTIDGRNIKVNLAGERNRRSSSNNYNQNSENSHKNYSRNRESSYSDFSSSSNFENNPDYANSYVKPRSKKNWGKSNY